MPGRAFKSLSIQRMHMGLVLKLSLKKLGMHTITYSGPYGSCFHLLKSYILVFVPRVNDIHSSETVSHSSIVVLVHVVKGRPYRK